MRELVTIFGLLLQPVSRHADENAVKQNQSHILYDMEPVCRILFSQTSQKDVMGDSVIDEDLSIEVFCPGLF